MPLGFFNEHFSLEATSTADEQEDPDQCGTAAAVSIVEKSISIAAAAAIVVIPSAAEQQNEDNPHAVASAVICCLCASAAVCCCQITHRRYLQNHLQCILCIIGAEGYTFSFFFLRAFKRA